mmetsp:Transcript_21437/g.48698  ORF Transcript_21437/g.48698 Transcript_21437/m.48698 type:complete len:134 (-) Transcript_21437:312-713(-)
MGCIPSSTIQNEPRRTEDNRFGRWTKSMIRMITDSGHALYRKKQKHVLRKISDDIFASEWTGSLTEDDDEQCYICLEKFEYRDMLVNIACGHRFHSDCIDAWIDWQSSKNISCTCPACRYVYKLPKRKCITKF